MRALKLLIAFNAFIFLNVACNAQSISPKDAAKYVGKTVTICGVVAGAIYLDRSRTKPTLLNLDKPFPDHIFSAVVYGEDRSKFGDPEKKCLHKNVCVTGEVSTFRDKPQIVMKDPSQLKGC